MIKGRQAIQDAYRDQRVARDYVAERFESPLGALLHKRQVKAIRDLVQAERIGRAAEVAPGPARVTVDTASAFNFMTLVDASAQMLDESRRRLAASGNKTPVAFVQADAFKLPLRDQFPLVYSFRLIRHFERADRVRIYRQIHDILSPRGWFVFDAVNEKVSAPMREAAPAEFQHFDALLRPETLRDELREAGFETVSLTGVQHHYPMLYKCQVYLAPRSRRLAEMAMAALDRLGGEPLEWIVVCRRA